VAGTRETVIENDIAWRVQAMVDFLFGQEVGIESRARDEGQRGLITRVLRRVWEQSGGVGLLQDAATLGHVFGHVDLVLRVDQEALLLAAEDVSASAAGSAEREALILRASDAVRIEVVDPRCGVAVLNPVDARDVRAYVIRVKGREGRRDRRVFPRALSWLTEGVRGRGSAREGWWTEVITPEGLRVHDGREVVREESTDWTGGRVPVVHVQNISLPFEYGGLGEVEPLVGLQDELNTRLSDRAYRVTMQSFRMYLAKGLEGIDKTPVGPGQIFYSENPDASLTSVGGDAPTPGEEEHIREIREALDKISSVPPLAGGVLQGRVGNLSSATALRMTLVGLLAKTQRKRVSYGRGMAEMSAMVLGVLDWGGVLGTGVGDRGVELVWRDPLGDLE
jgi:hypothetical protein